MTTSHEYIDSNQTPPLEECRDRKVRQINYLDTITTNDCKRAIDALIIHSGYKGRNIVEIFEQICDIIPENFPDKDKMRENVYISVIYLMFFKEPKFWNESWDKFYNFIDQYLNDIKEPWVDEINRILYNLL